MCVQGRGAIRRRRVGAGEAASVLDDREDVLLADDEEILEIDLELGPGVLRVQDLVADSDIHGLARTVVEGLARAGGEDDALLGLLLRGVRQDDARLRHLLTRRGLDDEAVAQRAELRRRGGGQGAFLLWRPRTGRRWPVTWIGTARPYRPRIYIMKK